MQEYKPLIMFGFAITSLTSVVLLIASLVMRRAQGKHYLVLSVLVNLLNAIGIIVFLILFM